MTLDHLLAAKQIDNDRCTFCGQSDSLTHRHCESEHTAPGKDGGL